MIDNFIDTYMTITDGAILLKAVFRLILAGILGGFIGIQREHINRPAGIRTHVLVCIGAALTVITSEFICFKYAGMANIDPTRLGAQVISGIGFLGAGTIIKEGFNVKGLTTAASLWAVSCVGLATGAGFYAGSIFATILIYITLQAAKKIIIRGSETQMVTVAVESADLTAKEIAKHFNQVDIIPLTSEIQVGENMKHIELKYLIALPKNKDLFAYSIDRIKMSDGVIDVHVE